MRISPFSGMVKGKNALSVLKKFITCRRCLVQGHMIDLRGVSVTFAGADYLVLEWWSSPGLRIRVGSQNPNFATI